MFRKLMFQDKPLRLKDFSEEDQMIIIQSCCEHFPEIAEAALDELLQVLYDLDLREVFGLGEDVPDC
jgi:hypothetical protein